MDTTDTTPDGRAYYIRFRCLTCRGPVRFVLDAHWYLKLDSEQAPRHTTGPATYTGKVSPDFIRAMMPNECEACCLARAKDDVERDALTRKLAELEAVAGTIGLSPSSPFTMQWDRWELRADRPDLEGFAVTSYGVWHQAPPEYIELSVRHRYVTIGDAPTLLAIYPLEIISHPDIPAELHVRWNPATRREWAEIENERGASIEQLKRLMDGLSLYRTQRPLGRHAGRKYSRDDVLEAYNAFYERMKQYPAQHQVATELKVNARTIRRSIGEPWSGFEVAARRAARSRNVRLKNR